MKNLIYSMVKNDVIQSNKATDQPRKFWRNTSYAHPVCYLLVVMMSGFCDTCDAQAITNPTIDASPTGLPYLLVVLVFALIFSIPIILWFYRNYISHFLKYAGVKITLYSAKAYYKVSMRVSDAGRKLSERVRI